jgi:hypothetical protein
VPCDRCFQGINGFHQKPPELLGKEKLLESSGTFQNGRHSLGDIRRQ